jgi:hypothetical protein
MSIGSYFTFPATTLAEITIAKGENYTFLSDEVNSWLMNVLRGTDKHTPYNSDTLLLMSFNLYFDTNTPSKIEQLVNIRIGTDYVTPIDSNPSTNISFIDSVKTCAIQVNVPVSVQSIINKANTKFSIKITNNTTANVGIAIVNQVAFTSYLPNGFCLQE